VNTNGLMKVLPEEIILPVLSIHQQAAFEDAWERLCSQQPSLHLLPQPSHLSALVARAVRQAGDNGASSHEDLVAAALRAMPGRKPPAKTGPKPKERVPVA
jgi:hypothetical protein